MTDLNKKITRKANATVFERGRHRKLIVSVEPVALAGAFVGVRLEGTRQTYRIGVNSIYNMAVQHHLNKVEKAAKRLVKEEGLKIRSARARASKELKKDLAIDLY